MLLFCRSFFILSIFFSASLYSDEESHSDKLVKAILLETNELFKQRSASNPQLLDQMLEKLAAVENRADDSGLNYDVYVFESKILYWKAKYILHAIEGNGKLVKEGLALFTLGKAKADSAKQFEDGYAEAFYYSGLHLGGTLPYLRYSDDPNRVTKLWDLAKQAGKEMDLAMNRPTRSDEPGYLYDGYGPYREKARIFIDGPTYWSPSEGWDQVSHWHYKKGYDVAREYAENVLLYVRYLINESGRVGRSKYVAFHAEAILNHLLSQDPNTYHPERIVETQYELELAKQLLSSCLCNYTSTKECLVDYASATRIEQDTAIRVSNSEVMLQRADGERVKWLELIKQQEKIFSTFDLLRTQIDEAAPELITRIQTALSSQEDTLLHVLESMQQQIKETKDRRVRESLEYNIHILSDLLIAKHNLGNVEELKKAIDTAVHGSGEERAKALKNFEPLTQAILKWVLQSTPPGIDNFFMEVKEEINRLQIFTKEHLSTIESEIQFLNRTLQYAKDDLIIAKFVSKRIYDACQNARSLQ